MELDSTPLPVTAAAPAAPATPPPPRPRLSEAELARLDRQAAGVQRFMRSMSRGRRERVFG
jgi:hypothetical protein